MPLPIVGARHRPPALPILEVLAADTPLILRREPNNPFDPNAIQVLVSTDQIAESAFPDLASKLVGYGMELEEIHAQPEWHLGYVPKTLAVEVAKRMDEAEEPECDGKLVFDPAGKPMVKSSHGEES